MGLLGPRRVDVGDVDAPTPPPYGLLDNAETLLAVSDLVFIDPMSTGHSRAAEGRKAPDFHGYAKDVEQVTELIRLWCTREDRWMSPKYLIGESYGTVRAVAVAERLSSKHALALNGLVLVSSVLDFGSQDFEHLRHDEASLNFLPSYAAIAHYHGLHEGRTLDEVRTEAEEFASGPYRLALAQGHRLPADERAEIVTTLARLAGVSEEYVDRTDLRIEHWRWCTEVLRDRGLAVGRIDGRYTGPLYSQIAENMDADPSSDAIEGPFAAALHHYLRGELGSTLDIPYEVFANAIKKWSYAEFEGKPINVADKLERLMRVNPHLRVRIEYGYYDLATPYHASEDMVAHLRLPAEAFDRIEHEYFETGHMPYLHEESRVREAEGIARFVTATESRWSEEGRSPGSKPRERHTLRSRGFVTVAARPPQPAAVNMLRVQVEPEDRAGAHQPGGLDGGAGRPVLPPAAGDRRTPVVQHRPRGQGQDRRTDAAAAQHRVDVHPDADHAAAPAGAGRARRCRPRRRRAARR